LLLGISLNFILSYRWKILLPINQVNVSFLRLVRLYFVGSFYNLFLPTSLGGDVVRGYGLAVYTGKKMSALTSILMERMIGFLSLMIVAIFALVLSGLVKSDPAVAASVIILCVGYFIFMAVIFSEKIMKKIIPLFKSTRFITLSNQLHRLVDSIQMFKKNKVVLLKSFLLSVICQILAILAIYLLALSIHLKLSPIHFFIIIPMIWILIMIPISMNGLGIREGSFVFFFTRIGVQDTTALLLSFLVLSVKIIIGLAGGIIYITDQLINMQTSKKRSQFAEDYNLYNSNTEKGGADEENVK